MKFFSLLLQFTLLLSEILLVFYADNIFPALIFPEESTTNGKLSLLKFRYYLYIINYFTRVNIMQQIGLHQLVGNQNLQVNVLKKYHVSLKFCFVLSVYFKCILLLCRMTAIPPSNANVCIFY